MQQVLCDICNNVSILQEVLLSGYLRKCPWKKLHKLLVIQFSFTKGRSNGTNIYVEFYLNHGPQEPEIYIANIPGGSNMIR
jgi:hypothetical protein